MSTDQTALEIIAEFNEHMRGIRKHPTSIVCSPDFDRPILVRRGMKLKQNIYRPMRNDDEFGRVAAAKMFEQNCGVPASDAHPKFAVHVDIAEKTPTHTGPWAEMFEQEHNCSAPDIVDWEKLARSQSSRSGEIGTESKPEIDIRMKTISALFDRLQNTQNVACRLHLATTIKTLLDQLTGVEEKSS
jgi:hypothetical protein